MFSSPQKTLVLLYRSRKKIKRMMMPQVSMVMMTTIRSRSRDPDLMLLLPHPICPTRTILLTHTSHGLFCSSHLSKDTGISSLNVPRFKIMKTWLLVLIVTALTHNYATATRCVLYVVVPGLISKQDHIVQSFCAHENPAKRRFVAFVVRI